MPYTVKRLSKVKKTKSKMSGDSKLHHQMWIMSNRQCVVDVPFRHPNCLGSTLLSISFIIHLTTQSSSTSDRQDVREIGLVSFLGGCDFEIGIISESFHIAETIPDVSDTLKTTASANSSANSLRMRQGMLSGPWALKGSHLLRLNTHYIKSDFL